MYRRVVLSNPQWLSGPFGLLYHVNGANLLEQRRVSTLGYEANFSPVSETSAVVFAGLARLHTSAGIGTHHTYEFIFDVAENQPVEESVEELTSTGVAINVYNENGVLVCRNTPKTPSNSALTQTVVPDEMTSVPGEEHGEMTSVPGEEPGEMTSVPIEAPGATI